MDQNGATPSRYGIRGIPALLFFKGGKVADQIVGYVPQDVIEEKVKSLLTEPAPLDCKVLKQARLGQFARGLLLWLRPAHVVRLLRRGPGIE